MKILLFCLSFTASICSAQTIYYCGNVGGQWVGPGPTITWYLTQTGTTIGGHVTDTRNNCTNNVSGPIHTDGTFILNAATNGSCLGYSYNMIPGMSLGVVGCETAESGDLVFKANSCQIPSSEGTSVFKGTSGGIASFDASILPSTINWSGRTVTEVVDNPQYTNCHPQPTIGPFGTWYIDSNNDIQHPTYDGIGFKYQFMVNTIRLGRADKTSNCVITEDQTMYIDCDSSIPPKTSTAKYEKHQIVITIGPVNLNVSRNGVSSGDFPYGLPQKTLDFLVPVSSNNPLFFHR